MPTARARTFLVAAGVLYLFANQTQVGWLYAMSALMAGVVLAGAWLGRGTLRGIAAERRIGLYTYSEFYENDSVSVELTLSRRAKTAAAQVRTTESCPLAAPDSAQRQTVMFIPSLPAGGSVQFTYEVDVYRRGVHEFPSLRLESRAPFGFFEQRHQIELPTPVLVYPELRALPHLDLLDRQLVPQIPRPRAGVGYEVMGVRPFRSGDSPRQVHWRSVARTGQLISKEYADEAQPGLTLVLDLYGHPYPQTNIKHTPFEWAVKCAASIGDYAQTRRYPLHLLADEQVMAVPGGPLNRWGLLQYLARVQPTGLSPLSGLLNRPVQNFVAVILPWPDRAVVAPLLELHHRRIEVLAVVIDPQTFPAGGPAAAPLVDELRAAGIDTRFVRYSPVRSEDWAQQLSESTSVFAGNTGSRS